MLPFQFHNPVQIKFGRGRRAEIAGIFPGLRTFVVADPFLANTPAYEQIRQSLGDGFAGACFDVSPNPEAEDANSAAAAARQSGAQAIVGLGGGSAMDMAKIAAAAACEIADTHDYLSGARVPAQRLALLLLPTTSGTGSEVTNVSVLSGALAGAHIKRSIVNSVLYADWAIIDPALSDSMPRPVTASTGFDAYCHAIEAYWAKASNPLSDALALWAVKLVLVNLQAACDNPTDTAARDGMALASLMAGVAFSQTRTTLLHGLSFPLTERYRVPHGTGCALLLERMIREHAGPLGEKLDTLARFCGLENATTLADRTGALYAACGMPSKLTGYGVVAGDLSSIAEQALKMPMSANNPVEFSAEQLRGMLERFV